ncbi:MAG: VCBS domain-containing protein, partial [Sulfurimonas sp.]|nr:VCBS domain-containing protein [Sulfurimonas sp.]
MATGKVIGQIKLLVGDVKIVGADGVVRDAKNGDFMYEGEQIVSTDPGAEFQIKYSALPEVAAYEGIFRVLVDGSVVAGADAMESITSDENLMDALDTAAGEEGANGSSAYIPTDVVAESSVQDFGRGLNPGPLGLNGVGAGAEFSDDLNDFAPTAEDGTNIGMEDNRANVTGTLVGADLDGNPIEYVLVDGLGEGEGTLILNPDGSYVYNVGYDFQTLAVGETQEVTFTYK